MAEKVTDRIGKLAVEKNYWDITTDDLSGLYVFYSVDLVDSTSFKSEHINEWPRIFTRFYELTVNELQSLQPGVRVWKYVGDEVLLYKKVQNINDLFVAPEFCSKTVTSVTDAIYNSSGFSLYLKGAVWIADVQYVQSLNMIENLKKTNILISIDNARGSNIDFLGPEIDLGFRLSKFVGTSKVAVSAELAFILFRKRGDVSHISKYSYQVEERLKVLSFEKLKGIWGSRRYPIIWYMNDWSAESFQYDEHYNSNLAQIVINEQYENIKIIEKVFSDLKRVSYLNTIIERLSNLDSQDEKQKDNFVEYNIPDYKLAEVHCAAICFNDEGEILIGKRPVDKKTLNSKWEFGCGQVKLDQTFQQCIETSYKEDFAAELDFGKELVLVTTYVVEKEKERNRKVPGLLFLAKVKNSKDVESGFSKTKHTEVKWIDPSKVDELDSKDYVPDFASSVKKASELYNIHFNK